MSTYFETLILRDIAANRPAAGKPGRLFYDTTNSKWQRDNGTSWDDCVGGLTQEQIEDVIGAMVSGNTETGISVTYDDTGGKLNFDASHTHSVLKNFWNPDAPPASPHANDDEFLDGSGGVPGGWTETDHGSKLTVVEDATYKHVALTHTGGAGTHNIAGIYKSVPAGDFTIWTKCSMFAIGDNVDVGLALFEDATSTTGDINTFGIRRAAPNAIQRNTWAAYNATPTNNFGESLILTTVYLRIRRNGTTYYFDFSNDGLGWKQGSFSGSFAVPTHMGLFVQNNGSNTVKGTFEFYRFLASDVGINGVMAGQLAGIYA